MLQKSEIRTKIYLLVNLVAIISIAYRWKSDEKN